MASATPLPQFNTPSRSPLDGLYSLFELEPGEQRERFARLWHQLHRHAPLFGCADHFDLDAEQLDAARMVNYRELARHARAGDQDAVERLAVSNFVSAMRSAIDLDAPRHEPDLDALLEEQSARLCEVAGCAHVPLREVFAYHQSLCRHYSIETAAFTELIDWIVAAIRRDERPRALERFLTRARQLAPRPVDPPEDDDHPLERDNFAELIPAATRANPVLLARFASEHAPTHRGPVGAGQPFTSRWYEALVADLSKAGFDELDASSVGQTKQLPELVHHALLVELLGLEDIWHKAVLAQAADRLLVHYLLPRAREVGASSNRHEPVAAYLVSVLAAALRPWSFDAPPLRVHEREVIVALLAELATGKARKLLHHEKKHAERHPEPDAKRLRAAVNRALDRLPARVHGPSPKQRIDRVAAGFRYLNRIRREREPRARDHAIVLELWPELSPVVIPTRQRSFVLP